MKQRVLSAIVMIAVFFLCVFLSPITRILIFLVLGILCVREYAAKMKETAEIAYGQVCEKLEGFDFSGFEKIIFIGKSIGTVLAARYAAEHNMHVKQVWYTPVEATFKFGVKKAVAFIGDNDPWSDYSEVVRLATEADIPLHTYAGCNHSLECGDVDRDLATLKEVMMLTEEFL